jgi:hypothetical protein
VKKLLALVLLLLAAPAMSSNYVDTFSAAGDLDSATSSDGLFTWGTSHIGVTGTKSGGSVTFTQSDYVTSAECATDHLYVEADYVSHSGGGGWWIALAKDSTYAGNGYLLNVTSSDITIYRINAGAYNVLSNASHSPSAGTYRLEYNRATGALTGSRNGVSLVTATNTAEPSGSGFRKAMIGFDGGTNAIFSEFRYGDVSAGGSVLPLIHQLQAANDDNFHGERMLVGARK